jgi:O-antigen/teichoic acid export membrane protein
MSVGAPPASLPPGPSNVARRVALRRGTRAAGATAGAGQSIGGASAVLIGSSFASSAIGLLYWLVAARSLSPAQLGLDAAVINTVMLASNLGGLDLVHAVPRYLPAAGNRAAAFVRTSYGVAVGLSLLVAVVFLVGVRTWTPSLAYLVDELAWTALFLVAVVAWSTFALQDCVLIALRRSNWVPIENVVFSVLKLGLLLVLVEVAPRYAVLLSWTLPALLFVAIVNLGVVRRAVRPTADTLPVSLPSRGRLTRTVLVGNGANIAGIVVAGTLPLLITERFGAEANASYYLAWSMAYVLFLAPRYVSLVVLSRAEHQPEQLDDITVRATLASTALVGVAALVTFVLARPVLGLVGSAYQDDAVGLLQLMSLAAVPHCAVVMVAAWARGRQRIVLAVVVSIAEYVAMIGFALLFVGRMGVVGFGWAWLAGETLAAVVLAGLAWRTRHIDLALVRNAVTARRVPNAAA